MNKVNSIDISRAVQILKRYDVVASWNSNKGWTLSEGLVDECVYARLTVDKEDRFCLYTASLCWHSDDLHEMIEAAVKINECLEELAQINENLIK